MLQASSEVLSAARRAARCCLGRRKTKCCDAVPPSCTFLLCRPETSRLPPPRLQRCQQRLPRRVSPSSGNSGADEMHGGKNVVLCSVREVQLVGPCRYGESERDMMR
ncbi:hypothetical protein VTH06DRAFT_6696 [Thermothelomyces fergusii]